MKIGFAMTSSFCTIREMLLQMKELVIKGYDLYPIVSPAIINVDTRFGSAREFRDRIEEITGKEPVSDIVGAEKFGPKEILDALIVAPATGNFIGKLANGITDNPVNMATKATIRNSKPIIIGLSTNDALGLNGQNIMRLLNTKNIFFIPFGQDDCINKPNSLISHWDLMIPTLEAALENRQLQPVLKEYSRIRK